MKKILAERKRLVITLACVLLAAAAGGAVAFWLVNRKTAEPAKPVPIVESEPEPEGPPSFAEILKNASGIKTVSMTVVNKVTMTTDGKTESEEKLEQTFFYKKPDMMVLKSPRDVIYIGKSEDTVEYMPDTKKYSVTKKNKKNLLNAMVFAAPGVNTPGMLTGADYTGKLLGSKYLKDEKVADWDCRVYKLKLRRSPDEAVYFDQTVWIEKEHGIMVRNTYTLPRSSPIEKVKREVSVDSVVTAFSADKDLDDSLFAFVPPKGAVKYDPAEEAKKMAAELKKLQQAQKEAEAKNPVGKKAFDFALKYYTEETVFVSGKKPESIFEAPDASKQEKPFGLDLKPLTEEIKDEAAPEAAGGQEAAAEAPEVPEVPVPEIKNVAHDTTFYSVSAAKNTLVAFWAYPDGKEFLDMLDKIYADEKDKYNFITICLNVESEEENALEDFRAAGHQYPIYFMKPDDTPKVIDKWIIQGIPMVYFIDDKSVMKQYLFGDDNVTDKKIREGLDANFKK